MVEIVIQKIGISLKDILRYKGIPAGEIRRTNLELIPEELLPYIKMFGLQEVSMRKTGLAVVLVGGEAGQYGYREASLWRRDEKGYGTNHIYDNTLYYPFGREDYCLEKNMGLGITLPTKKRTNTRLLLLNYLD